MSGPGRRAIVPARRAAARACGRVLGLLAAMAAAPAAIGSAAPGSPGKPPAVVATAVADSGLAAAGLRLPARVSARPGHVRLGEPLHLRAWVVLPHATLAQWLPPDSGGAFTWSALAARRVAGPGGRDTLWLETQLQIFTTGVVSVPGPSFRFLRSRDRAVRALPTVRVTVEASPGIADSSAQLHALRAPLEAPWWERVPWTLVALGVGLLAAVLAWRRWRRRRGPQVKPVPALARAARDPADVALEELEALRRLGLPRAGRFGDHALRLTRIARRFLEATAGTPRPGDSTPELVRHLEAAQLESGQLARLATLLRAWDQVKFAREPSTVAESERAEQGVEEMARRRLLELRPETAPGSPGASPTSSPASSPTSLPPGPTGRVA